MKKKGNKKTPILRQEVIDNPIPIYIFVFCLKGVVICPQIASSVSTKQTEQLHIRNEQRCRDGVINDFLSQYRRFLVPLLFYELTSLHPPSFQRNDFSTCKYVCATLIDGLAR